MTERSQTELPSWLRQIGPNLWETTEQLRYMTDSGEVVIEAPFQTDLYTASPNTSHHKLWLPPVLHDYLLVMLKAGTPVKGFETRRSIDDAFYYEMVVQSTLVFAELLPTCGKKESIKVLLGLLRLSEMYYDAVRAYGWFWTWWHK